MEHVYLIYPDGADHIIKFLAHRVQKPQEKINHALLLGGAQGIGKDTLLEPVKRAAGHWNFGEASPQDMFAPFNKFVRSVILRVSEGRDLGDVDRYKLYDRMKTICASPPDVLKVNEKNIKEYYVANVCGVILTSNYKTDGVYLPEDDRRHYVAYSELTKEDFTQEYWNDIWAWYEGEGSGHVTAYLRTLDISTFNAKAPPPRTQAFYDIVDASIAPEIPEALDVIDIMGNPKAFTLSQLQSKATGEFLLWLTERKNRRAIPHRLERCGYIPVHNTYRKDRYWQIDGERQAVYADKKLSLSDRIKAACALVKGKSHV